MGVCCGSAKRACARTYLACAKASECSQNHSVYRPDGFFKVILAVVISSVDHLEKVGRRQLLVVTDNDNLFGPRDNPKRILRGDLAGLVDDKEVETKPTGLKELSYRQWAHEEHRLQTLNR